MGSIGVTMWVTLDGVLQGLARPDEDTSGGFTHGVWGPRYGDEVTGLKARSDRELGIVGSASLVRSLHAAGLIDRYTLVICPLTLGSGTRLFEGPAPLTEFELTDSVATTTGAIIAQYSRR